MTAERQAATQTPRNHVGRSYPGLTNRRLATGNGEYVSDLRLPDMAYLAVLRSPHAHARIKSVDTSAAHAAPGVIYVMVGTEAKENMRPIPEGWNTKAIGAKGIEWYALAPDRVRYAGEAVAAVVATDRNAAYHARNLISVD